MLYKMVSLDLIFKNLHTLYPMRRIVMEQRKHEMGLLDLMNRPAFCVAEGKITQVNAAAAAFGLAPQMELAPLLANGSEIGRAHV